MPSSDSQFLVWGAGAMGGTIGAALIDAGHDVLFVDRWAEHARAITERGLRIRGPIREFTVTADAVEPDGLHGKHRWVLLCVKAHHTAEAMQQLAPHLADDGYVVSIQNGLNESVIAAHVGSDRTVGAFVNFGADVLEPGVVHWGGRGAVVVGELDGSDSDRVQELVGALRVFEPNARATTNIQGYLWGKLAYGALLFATALTDDSIADVLAAPEFRPLLVEIGREVCRVAQARGIDPEGFDGFDPGAFAPGAPDALAEQSLDDLVRFNRRSAKTHSGIWRDLAIRKRKTEVDAQLGPIETEGREAGISVPLVSALIRGIHDIEAGRRALAQENLRALLPLLGESA